MTWNGAKLIRALGHSSRAPATYDWPGSRPTSVIASASPPCAARSLAKAPKVLWIATRRAEQHPAPVEIAEQRQEALPLAGAAFVGTDPADLRIVFLRPGCIHRGVAHPPPPVVGHSRQPRHRQHRHLLAQRHNEGFQHLREARSVACPRHRDLRGLAALPTLHPRHLGVHAGLVLKEVQVSPTACLAVMHRLLGCAAGRTRQPCSITPQVAVDAASIRRELIRATPPTAVSPQSLREERFHPVSRAARSGRPQASSTRIEKEPNLATNFPRMHSRLRIKLPRRRPKLACRSMAARSGVRRWKRCAAWRWTGWRKANRRCIRNGNTHWS